MKSWQQINKHAQLIFHHYFLTRLCKPSKMCTQALFWVCVCRLSFRKSNNIVTLYATSSLPTWCNTTSRPPWGASAKWVHSVAYLRQPDVFLSTREEWNFSLWSSSKVELLHPEWGMITVLVRVVKASPMIVIFTTSHDDRFHSTPARTPTDKHRCEENRCAKTSCYVSWPVQLGDAAP